jgi:hypothetical protein
MSGIDDLLLNSINEKSGRPHIDRPQLTRSRGWEETPGVRKTTR